MEYILSLFVFLHQYGTDTEHNTCLNQCDNELGQK